MSPDNVQLFPCCYFPLYLSDIESVYALMNIRYERCLPECRKETLEKGLPPALYTLQYKIRFELSFFNAKDFWKVMLVVILDNDGVLL